MKSKLWTVLGPVVLALLIVAGIMLTPLHFGQLQEGTMRKASVSLSTNVLLGTRIKHQALNGNYVPFVGSSELSRMDPFHPSVLARKYERTYQPLLLGNAGTQSLSHFINLQSTMPQLRGRKMVLIVSPQWFTHGGQRPDAFGFYYSPLETSNWLLTAKDSVATRYAARRLLQMPVTHSNPLIHRALLDVAAGQPLGGTYKLLKMQTQVLQNEDNFFSHFNLLSNNNNRINAAAKWLPESDNPQQLNALAGRIAAQHTSNNKFGIDNHFFSSRLSHGRLHHLRGKQRKFDYRQSPEYSDFELLLSQFAKYKINVQFVIPPVNTRWSKYTGLSQTMYQDTVTKIKTQLSTQGFNNVLDLSQDGAKPYFMQDTIHLGWRGWVAVDQAVRPFLENYQLTPHYHIDNDYFSKTWQKYE